MTEKLTEEEIKRLRELRDKPELWDNYCNLLKRRRKGEYPSDWYEVVVVGKIIKNNIKVIPLG